MSWWLLALESVDCCRFSCALASSSTASDCCLNASVSLVSHLMRAATPVTSRAAAAITSPTGPSSALMATLSAVVAAVSRVDATVERDSPADMPPSAKVFAVMMPVLAISATICSSVAPLPSFAIAAALASASAFLSSVGTSSLFAASAAIAAAAASSCWRVNACMTLLLP